MGQARYNEAIFQWGIGMADVLDFVTRHWMLFGGFCFTAVIIAVYELRQRSLGAVKVSPQELIDLMSHEEAAVLDIRSVDGYREGHILGSQHVPAGDLTEKSKTLEKHKSKPIILVCELGHQSSKVASQLKSSGFEQVHFMAGGLGAWKAEGLPLTKKG